MRGKMVIEVEDISNGLLVHWQSRQDQGREHTVAFVEPGNSSIHAAASQVSGEIGTVGGVVIAQPTSTIAGENIAGSLVVICPGARLPEASEGWLSIIPVQDVRVPS